MPTIGLSTSTTSEGGGDRQGGLGRRRRRRRAERAAAACDGPDSRRRTVMRTPSSSTVSSPASDSSSRRTRRRTRRASSSSSGSSSPMSASRPRSRCSSGSARSPKSATRHRSSSEAARLPASSRASSSDGSLAVEAGARSAAASAIGIDGRGRVAPLAEQQAAHVAVDLGPAARVQDVADGLAGEDAADRRGGRRIAALGAHAQQLVEHLVEPVLGARRRAGCARCRRRRRSARSRARRAGPRAARRAGRWRRRRRARPRSRARPPRRASRSSPASKPSPESAWPSSSAAGRVVSIATGIRRGRDGIGARARRLDRDGQRGAARPLRVEADGHAGGGDQLADQLAGAGRVERARGVLQQDAVGAHVGQPARVLEQVVVALGPVGVDEARVEARARLAHGGGGHGEVVDVVERVVHAEDVDARLRGAQHEAAHEIVRRGPAADQERAAQRHRERRARAAAHGADALPGTLQAALDGGREAAAARDLERAVADRRRAARPGAARSRSRACAPADPGTAGAAWCRRSGSWELRHGRGSGRRACRRARARPRSRTAAPAPSRPSRAPPASSRWRRCRP